jgi:hypothetical protein
MRCLTRVYICLEFSKWDLCAFLPRHAIYLGTPTFNTHPNFIFRRIQFVIIQLETLALEFLDRKMSITKSGFQ